MANNPKLIIHGGCGSLTPKTSIERENALRDIYECAETFLKRHSAVETVHYAVTLLEDNPLFNAGTGAKLQKDGKARLSASIMDGTRVSFAGVINIEEVKNPISIARLLLKEKDTVLSGQLATAFAREKGFESFNAIIPARLEQWEKEIQEARPIGDATGTVGACALDREGNLAAATSTGGKGYERAGRVSDSAMPAGNYAGLVAAISCTGTGEQIVNGGVAIKIVTRVEDGLSIESAFEKSFKEIRTQGHSIGAIGIARNGDIMTDFTTEMMNYAYRNDMGSIMIKK